MDLRDITGQFHSQNTGFTGSLQKIQDITGRKLQFSQNTGHTGNTGRMGGL